jgi:hypothetical protein
MEDFHMNLNFPAGFRSPKAAKSWPALVMPFPANSAKSSALLA